MTTLSKTQMILAISFLVSIFAVGIVQAFLDIGEGDRPQCLDLFFYPPTQKNLRAYESELEQSSWFSQQLQPGMRWLLWTVFHDAGDKALLGKMKWLFFRPGARYLIESLPSKMHDDAVRAIVDFKDQLNQRKIKLLVLPMPGKASVYPNRLVSIKDNKLSSVYAHTANLIHELQEKGVEVVDLFQYYSQRNQSQSSENPQELYLTQDTHWAPQGLQLAAKHIAERLLSLGWIERGTAEYRQKQISIKRYGDLIQMMDIPYLKHAYQPQSMECFQIITSEDGAPYRDNPQSDILILGDSFLRIFERDAPGSAGLVSHLAFELQQPLASIISDGGASTLVRQELARKPELLQGKKVVIWEFVERDIRYGTEGWQLVSLSK